MRDGGVRVSLSAPDVDLALGEEGQNRKGCQVDIGGEGDEGEFLELGSVG